MTRKRKLEPIPDYGDRMTLRSFIRDCHDGMLTDYDGIGYYATRAKMSRLVAHPSNIVKGRIRHEWSHVVWFNR